MPPRINFRDATKQYGIVVAKEKAWHGLGTVLPDRFTSEEAIKYANLDYVVALAPIHARFSEDIDDLNRTKQVPDSFATYRTDTRDIFGIVGKRYEVVQNNEAFKFFDSIVGQNKAIYETAGCLDNGEIVFLTAKLPDNIILPGDDITEKYLMLSMSHDATKPITALFTPTRVVCGNTLAMALANGTSRIVIRHTKSAHDRLEEASKLMGLIEKRSSELTELLSTMCKISVNQERIENYLELVFLSSEEMKRLAETGSAHDYKKAGISTQKLTTMEQVLDFYYEGVGQNTKSTVGTLFGAYSAVTGWMFNVKDYKTSESRLKSLVLEGQDYQINARALNVAQSLITTW